MQMFLQTNVDAEISLALQCFPAFFFAQNNFTVVISMQKVRVQKISLIWSCQVLNQLTKLFPIKIKNIVSQTLKNLRIVSNFYVILRMFYETT